MTEKKSATGILPERPGRRRRRLWWAGIGVLALLGAGIVVGNSFVFCKFDRDAPARWKVQSAASLVLFLPADSVLRPGPFPYPTYDDVLVLDPAGGTEEGIVTLGHARLDGYRCTVDRRDDEQRAVTCTQADEAS
jgi:hypothetical protein